MGYIISALVSAWDKAKMIRARKSIDAQWVKRDEIFGPLFFGSASNFTEKFDVDEDPQEIIIDFKESRIVDMSALEALKKMNDRYALLGKRMALRNVSDEGLRLIENTKGAVVLQILDK